MLPDRADVAARDHAAERARGSEFLDVVDRAAQERQQSAQRVFLRDPELLPQRDRLGDERDDEGAREVGPDVVERAAALRHPQGTRPEGACQAPELSRQRRSPGDRNGAAAQVEGFPGLAEHPQRMKAAHAGALRRGPGEQVEVAGPAAMHAGRSGAPANSRSDRLDRVVGHGEENQIGEVGGFLRRSYRARSRDAARESPGRSRAAAGDRDDFSPRARQGESEPGTHPARTDDSQLQLLFRHLLPIVRRRPQATSREPGQRGR